VSGNLTSSSFTNSFLSTILGFFQSIIGVFVADFQQLLQWTGNQVTLLFLTWGNSFSGYGPFIPAIFVVSIGGTILGIYVVLIFIDAGKDLVGE
jgi:hypothetical protein